jgi:hypothetical protein
MSEIQRGLLGSGWARSETTIMFYASIGRDGFGRAFCRYYYVCSM